MYSSLVVYSAGGAIRVNGAVRGCVSATKDTCENGNGIAIPELGLTDANGHFCVCSGDLCNSAPQAHVGRMAISFTVISLLALAAARFLSQ